MSRREIDEELVSSIEAKIEWEGMDDYFINYAWDDLEGTEAEQALRNYLDARTELLSILSDAGVDV